MTPTPHEFSISDWLNHIQNQHWRTMDLTLDRISQVWNNLNANLEIGREHFTIVVAGTNGKGSCVSMLDAVFQCSGLSTGAYTSPHLVRFNERIKVNGEEATDEEICNAFSRIEQARDNIPLTYFEYGTLCALLIFHRHKVDISILEVGMGGRLDAVNIVNNDLVLLTSIGIDHEQWLGSNRENIAAEKAGVIKHGGKVICADPDIPESVLRISDEQNATLLGFGRDYFIEESEHGTRWKSDHAGVPQEWRNISSLSPPFNGVHQRTNMAGVVASAALTSSQTGVAVEDLKLGIGQAKLFARCQVIAASSNNSPEVIVDVAHNKDSAFELSRFLEARECSGNTYAVFGVLADKALDQIVERLSELVDHWILASLGGERGQSGYDLAEKLMKVAPNSHWVVRENPVEAYFTAMDKASPEDRVVIFGSFYTVGDIIEHIELAM